MNASCRGARGIVFSVPVGAASFCDIFTLFLLRAVYMCCWCVTVAAFNSDPIFQGCGVTGIIMDGYRYFYSFPEKPLAAINRESP